MPRFVQPQPPQDLQALYNLFKVNPNALPGVNPASFNSVANAEASSTAPSHESMREADLLAEQDARASAGINADLARAEQTRHLREDLGFNGEFPEEDAANAAQQDKLRTLLLPKQMELAAAEANHAATREFNAEQNRLNREAMQSRVDTTQQNMDQRQRMQQAESRARAIETGKTPVAGVGLLRKLFGVLPFVDSNQDLQNREAARVRSEALSAAPATAGAVAMVAPDGRRLLVPMDKVAELEAAGAQRAE